MAYEPKGRYWNDFKVPDRGVVTYEVAVKNQTSETVMHCEQSVLMMRRRP